MRLQASDVMVIGDGNVVIGNAATGTAEEVAADSTQGIIFVDGSFNVIESNTADYMGVQGLSSGLTVVKNTATGTEAFLKSIYIDNVHDTVIRCAGIRRRLGLRVALAPVYLRACVGLLRALQSAPVGDRLQV